MRRTVLEWRMQRVCTWRKYPGFCERVNKLCHTGICPFEVLAKLLCMLHAMYQLCTTFEGF